MTERKKIGRASGSTKKVMKNCRQGNYKRYSDRSKPHSLFGALKGTVTIAPGVDLTEPADPYWGLDLDAFKESLVNTVPPRAIAPALVALWWAKKGDWDKAHRLVMDETSREAAWVHAYLHRVEGDLPNARWWYKEAKRPAASGPPKVEWEAIVRVLLDRAGSKGRE